MRKEVLFVEYGNLAPESYTLLSTTEAPLGGLPAWELRTCGQGGTSIGKASSEIIHFLRVKGLLNFITTEFCAAGKWCIKAIWE